MKQENLLKETLDQLYSSGPPAQQTSQVVARLERSAAEWSKTVWYGTLSESRVGPLLIAVGPNGVLAIEFGRDERGFARRLAETHGSQVLRAQERVEPVAAQLRQYLDGGRRAFDLEIDLGKVSAFQRHVLEAASQVPAGVIETYGEIARRIGKPRAARAVGQALARNPIPIVVPCHRVVAADGSLTGYSGRGGIKTKAELLKLEGAALA